MNLIFCRSRQLTTYDTKRIQFVSFKIPLLTTYALQFLILKTSAPHAETLYNFTVQRPTLTVLVLSYLAHQQISDSPFLALRLLC